MCCIFSRSAQSNNEQQHNRTNTTIAALSAVPGSSYRKPDPYNRVLSAPEYDGDINVEFQNPESQSDVASNQGAHLIDDVDVGGLPGHRDGQNVMRTIVTSSSGYAKFILNFESFFWFKFGKCLIIMHNANYVLAEKLEEIVLIEILKVPERYVFMTKRKVCSSIINMIV